MYKTFLHILLLSTLTGILGSTRIDELYNKSNSRSFEKEIRQILECVLDIFRTGLPEHGFAPLDPFKVETATYYPSNPIAKGSVTLEDFHAIGLSYWDIEYLDGTIGIFPPSYTLKAVLNLKLIEALGKYHGNIKLMGDPIFGNGTITGRAENFKVDLTLKLKLLNQKLDKADIILSLGQAKIDIKGFMNNAEESERISYWLSNELPKFMEQNKQMITDKIRDLIMGAMSKRNVETSYDLVETLISAPFENRDVISEIINRCKP